MSSRLCTRHTISRLPMPCEQALPQSCAPTNASTEATAARTARRLMVCWKTNSVFRAMLCPTGSLRVLACHPPTPVWYVLSPGLRAPPI
ncbi:putative beta-glucosidase G [Alternaria alternata]|nr:putative beta-glucosidase G [Alternaria alternata]